DSAVYTLRHSDGTTNSQYDLMYLFVDYDSAGPTSRIKIKPVWDINSGTGQGTSGPTVTALTLSGRVHDVGATLANIDGQSDSYDMVLTMTREISGTPYVHWITLFDVRKTVSNNGITISSTSPLYFYQNSQGDKGTDVTIFDYDSDGNQDIGIIDSYHNVYTTPWLYFGRIYTNGTVISLTTAGGSGSTVLQFVYTDSDIGFTLMSDTSKRLFSISYADTKWIRQHIVYINGTGAMQFALDEKYAPLHVRGQFAPLGLGQGDAVDFSPDTDNLRDNFNVYYHNSNAYYTIEWDNRVNSHP
ncbi:MAG TPA: hypothetical protein VNI77_12540, partial [Nitrososphaera sp.]|nr:hypothetical protein [Nitrososphaera sp.]